LKRAFPQKVKSVPSCTTETDIMTGQHKQALPETNRRTSTSAAMIGLAISVGAHSLLLPSQGDSAIAAEPVASEPTTTAVTSSTFDVATLSSEADVTPSSATFSTGASVTEHSVQEGQTLWKIARFYGVDATIVARMNGIPPNAVLHVGQILRIPVDTRVARAIDANSTAGISARYYGPVVNTPDSDSSLNADAAALKSKQDASLDRLKQKRDSLQRGLSQLKAAKQTVAVSPPESLPSVESASAVTPLTATTTYRVVGGDTLGTIAQKSGISQKQLIAVNHLRNPNLLYVNQELTIPTANFVAPAATTAEPSAIVPERTQPSATQVPASVVNTSAAVLPNTTGGNSAVALSFVPKTNKAESLKPTATAKPEFKAKIASLPTPASQPEASVASASLNQGRVLPAQGQSATVATAPFVNNRSLQTGEADTATRYNYVENLRLEIVKLREKYRGTAAQMPTSLSVTTKPTSVASADSSFVPTRVNPEFSPTGYSETVRTQLRKLQTQQQPRPAKTILPSARSNSAESPSESQLVATAPLGSQNYDALVSSLGKVVSPDLPPLGSVDSYLPKNPGKFNGYAWPAKGLLTSGFGWRWGRMHKGIDIAAPIGTPVAAAAPGVIISAGWNSGGYGNLVEIQHADGSVTLYAHNNRILVREGQYVDQGQQVAEMGSTGYSTGPHCHFEVHLPGQGAVNPMAHLPGRENA